MKAREQSFSDVRDVTQMQFLRSLDIFGKIRLRNSQSLRKTIFWALLKSVHCCKFFIRSGKFGNSKIVSPYEDAVKGEAITISQLQGAKKTE